jgi:hypothetical protein
MSTYKINKAKQRYNEARERMLKKKYSQRCINCEQIKQEKKQNENIQH